MNILQVHIYSLSAHTHIVYIVVVTFSNEGEVNLGLHHTAVMPNSIAEQDIQLSLVG